MNLWHSNYLKIIHHHYGIPTMNQAMCGVMEIYQRNERCFISMKMSAWCWQIGRREGETKIKRIKYSVNSDTSMFRT